jgi:hypothetical protein
MGATLSTLRKYIRAEVHDPAPLRKISSSALIHDGGSAAVFFQDATFNFVTLGIVVGDVIWNGSDGGSISTIQQITGTGNRKLVVGAIEGGTNNDFTDGDTPYIYDRHAQKGLDGTRFTDTEVEDALAQSQKLVALRYGGVEKFTVHEDIKVVTKADLITLHADKVFAVAEQVTGGDNSHGATVEYVGDDFILLSRFITRVPIDGVSGTFQVGEQVQGATNSYAGIVKVVNANYLDLYAVSGEYDDDEVITGQTTEAYATVNSASSYSSASFAVGETLTGGTSAATANMKIASTMNNFYIGQDMPTDLKHLVNARWWDGSNWNYLVRQSIYEYDLNQRSTGDPLAFNVFSGKIWMWPNSSVYKYNELHMFYMAWDNTLSADTDTTLYGNRLERVVVLEAAKVLAGGDADEKMYSRLLADIKLAHEDIVGGEDMHTSSVGQVINWDTGFGPGELW